MGTIYKIQDGNINHYIASSAYCICNTEGETAVKIANLIGDQADNASTADFTLVKGVTIYVKFKYAHNSNINPMLNVANTGAKSIMRYGTVHAQSGSQKSWPAGAIVSLTYDGTNWIMNDVTAVTASNTNGNIKINGTETTVYTHPSGTNPHGTTKADVGLGNVGNFKAVSTVANQGLTSTEQANARVNIGAGTSSLTLGTSSTTAYRGDYGNTAYTHSQSDHSGIKPAFTEASSRANITTGESLATIFGKIKKFFTDLKAVAFSGSYSDLSDKPKIPTFIATGSSAAQLTNGALTLSKEALGLPDSEDPRKYYWLASARYLSTQPAVAPSISHQASETGVNLYFRNGGSLVTGVISYQLVGIRMP